MAVARGRLAWLALGPDDLALAARAVAAVDVPTVIAISGPRTAATDDLLDELDQIVLVAPPTPSPASKRSRSPACGTRRPVVVRRPLAARARAPAAMAGWGRLRGGAGAGAAACG